MFGGWVRCFMVMRAPRSMRSADSMYMRYNVEFIKFRGQSTYSPGWIANHEGPRVLPAISLSSTSHCSPGSALAAGFPTVEWRYCRYVPCWRFGAVLRGGGGGGGGLSMFVVAARGDATDTVRGTEVCSSCAGSGTDIPFFVSIIFFCRPGWLTTRGSMAIFRGGGLLLGMGHGMEEALVPLDLTLCFSPPSSSTLEMPLRR